jgi:DNA-binding LacI/PurR family transcriptional regulator/signal transduction histidine kinase
VSNGREILEPRGGDRQPPRLTFGFLTHYFSRDHMSLSLWQGIADQARLENVNLICFPGNAPQSHAWFEAQANSVYRLVDKKNIDGLLVWGSGMLGSTTLENVQSLFHTFRDFPTVNIGLILEDIPGIVIDNYEGVIAACSHLIEEHGCRRIAFIRGPENHQEANLRYRAYEDALQRHHVALDERLVITGNFMREVARRLTTVILDERRIRPDAVVAANDLMAMGVLEELSARRISVPDEVKVIGFDDLEETQYLKVPLTTVRQPFYEMGRLAVKKLVALIRGQDDREITTIPSVLVTRQSCGCLNPLVRQTPVAVSEVSITVTGDDETLQHEMEKTVIEKVQASNVWSEESVHAAFLILAAALREIRQGEPVFLATLNRHLARIDSLPEVAFFHSLLTELRRALLPLVHHDPARFLTVENLWQQSRILIGDFAQRMAVLSGFQKLKQYEVVQYINRILITSFAIDEIIEFLADSLVRLEVKTCFLALYEDSASLANARLRLAFIDHQRRPIDPRGILFPSLSLTPDGLRPADGLSNFIIHPLYFEKEQLGFILLEEGPQVGVVNEILRAQLSAAIQGALLFQEKNTLLADLERRARELQASSEDLARANADLEQFAIIASHDLREPLRKISLFADRLKDNAHLQSAPRHLEYLDRMQAACLRMNTLIGELLTYSRLSSQVPHFTQVSLTELMKETLSEFDRQISRTQAVIEVGDLPSLQAERHHLRLLFHNLIDNALKFQVPDRPAVIRISGREVRQDGIVSCEIAVADNGIGIEEKYFDRVFGVFQRLHSTREFDGTGMGLAMCRKIAERHRGHIRIESRPGEGARFVVTLPLSHG